MVTVNTSCKSLGGSRKVTATLTQKKLINNLVNANRVSHYHTPEEAVATNCDMCRIQDHTRGRRLKVYDFCEGDLTSV